MLEKRVTHYPLQYILKEINFFNIKVKVSPGVFIPRPETEILVEETITLSKKFFSRFSPIHILDLGTGTGAILISLVKEIENAQGIGIDLNPLAISLSKENANLNNVDKVSFIEGDIFSPERFTISKKFDIIVSNPPYISQKEISELQPEVVEYDPIMALDGGKEGLLFYPYILKWASLYLKEKGIIVLEIGKGQWDSIKKIITQFGFKDMYARKDFNNIERVGVVWRGKS